MVTSGNGGSTQQKTKSGSGRMIGASNHRQPWAPTKPKSLVVNNGRGLVIGDGSCFDTMKKRLINKVRQMDDGVDVAQSMEARKLPRFESQ